MTAGGGQLWARVGRRQRSVDLRFPADSHVHNNLYFLP